ncbi:ABC transporter ATP-binding protein [Belnapia sp. T6]|uniref:ABC transporter ATP-binding protein n=1 Tax=Belnapia mucosa TaxID=2804532 RepID=A0ABS1VC43_9PROT|nr:ABC transporter ATP-binding protein [Belnapia mucosa]MBL6457958.1 ABC transporter ATP-binding protein [Belnapia mucosa]
MGTLGLDSLSRRYGGTVAVERVDLEVAEGELVALLGPSGCGKTTTLRMVAGFVPPSSGTVRIGGRDVTRLPPHARDTGMVFQSYALFPHMSVGRNVAFGLEMRGIGKAERETRVREALRLVRLEGLEDRLPRQLSGGQQQRVALARALVVNPAVFLLDEPLSNLDAKLRAEVRAEIRGLQQRLGLTTLFVTHDQEEALTMADRLVVMERGRVRQVGTAEAIYARPADLFVAGFIGRINVLRGRLEGPGRFLAEGPTGPAATLPCPAATPPARPVLTIRPERIGIRPGAESGIPARLVQTAYLGPRTEYHFDLGTPGSGPVPLLAIRDTPGPAEPLHRLRTGDAAGLHWEAEDALLLPDDPA